MCWPRTIKRAIKLLVALQRNRVRLMRSKYHINLFFSDVPYKRFTCDVGVGIVGDCPPDVMALMEVANNLSVDFYLRLNVHKKDFS
jgi:hypothetical protein